MKPSLPRERIDAALNSLKDFQRDTAEYVFSRLYGSEDPCRRILVSDEVGLGKTMVAKGVIARTLEHLWDKVKRIDVVYVCSNADIARQNVNRLNVLQGDEGFRTAERLTLLAQEISRLGDVNFIALTPGTSFDLGSSLGIARERALLYWILKDAWGLGSGVAPFNVLRGNVSVDRFKSRVAYDEPDKEQRATLAHRFMKGLGDEADTVRAEFDALCVEIGHRRSELSREERARRNRFIANVRLALAKSCIEELNPDLVILDEFQRFKDILTGEDEAAQLAKSLFDYQDQHSQAKVMLLSATPYRMLTLSSQGDEEDHYADFLKTIEFLVPDAGRFSEYRSAVENFRMEFIRLKTTGDINAVLRAKDELAWRLRKVMVRTERLAHTADRSGMLAERAVPERLRAEDVAAYVGGQRIASVINQRDTIEFWKSAPFFLSFLEGYQMRDRLKAARKDSEMAKAIALALPDLRAGSLPLRAMSSDLPIEPSNSRLRGFIEAYEREGATDLLWIPPALSYYQLEGSYARVDPTRLTKRLLFSSWRMVPKSLASTMSYIVANRALNRYDEARGQQGSGKSRWPSPLLRFQQESDKRLTGMPITTLVYPSTYLARRVDPLDVASSLLKDLGRIPTAQEVRERTKQRIQEKLFLLHRWQGSSSVIDERWYWAAGVLFDLANNELVTRRFLGQQGLAGAMQGEVEGESESKEDHWVQHVNALASLASTAELGGQPQDLADVLADVAMGSPSVCALRALRRGMGELAQADEVVAMLGASRIGWGLRNLFNLPEAMVLLRADGRGEPYWRRVLRHSIAGGLQAVLDEYCHVLVDSEGLWNSEPAVRFGIIADEVAKALGLRPAQIGADELQASSDGASFEMETHRLKGRFAMPLVESRAVDTGADVKVESQSTRTNKVRAAFNSPFWPFVLISTSIGQEGLDFHRYCHAVVHWNLPTNPVDLEQREGRVHRFKGHAVRKNLAADFGRNCIAESASDPWELIFSKAAAARPAGANQMVPYWIYPKTDGAVIERHVPSMPLSREAERIVDLRRTLAVYRMVFGQPRQEDLIEYLMTRFGEEERSRLIEELRIDLSPPQSVRVT